MAAEKRVWGFYIPDAPCMELVGGDWNMTCFFPEKLGISSSQLIFISFRGVAEPPTRIESLDRETYIHIENYRIYDIESIYLYKK